MSDNLIKANSLLSNLSAYIASKYNISSRDAASIVMQSRIADDIVRPDSPYLDKTVEQLSAELVASVK